jgi:hypothetical protein
MLKPFIAGNLYIRKVPDRMNQDLQDMQKNDNQIYSFSHLLVVLICLSSIMGLLLYSLDVPQRALKWVRNHRTFFVAKPDQVKSEMQGLKLDQMLDVRSPHMIAGPLRVDTAIYGREWQGDLAAGSHTWLNFQDSGGSNPPPVFDYNIYLDFLQANNHNFFRLWVW